jgi:hypothetical protein
MIPKQIAIYNTLLEIQFSAIATVQRAQRYFSLRRRSFAPAA